MYICDTDHVNKQSHVLLWITRKSYHQVIGYTQLWSSCSWSSAVIKENGGTFYFQISNWIKIITRTLKMNTKLLRKEKNRSIFTSGFSLLYFLWMNDSLVFNPNKSWAEVTHLCLCNNAFPSNWGDTTRTLKLAAHLLGDVSSTSWKKNGFWLHPQSWRIFVN